MRPISLAVSMCAVIVSCSRANNASSDTSAVVLDTAPAPRAPAARPALPPPITQKVAVGFDGFGPLRIGMTLDQARAALPGFALKKDADEMACGYAASTGLPSGITVMVEHGSVRRIDVDTPKIPTDDGARVGDTEAKVKSLYPRVESTPHKYAERGHYLTVRNSSDTTQQVIFETDGTRVLRYRAGRTPQVAYVEGCG